VLVLRACLLLRRLDFNSSSGEQTLVFVSPLHLSFGRAIGFASDSILDMYVLLSPIPHHDDFMLHQVFVGVGD